MSLTAAAIYQFIKSRDMIQDILKEKARELAAFYDGAVKIEINISKEKGEPKVNVTEYNL